MDYSDTDSSINEEIDALRSRLEPPIRLKNERAFSRLINGLIDRARQNENQEDEERLITHRVAIQRQWIPLAVRDDLLSDWKIALNEDGQKFLERYNLFVERKFHEVSPERWTLLWNHYTLFMSLHRRINEWIVVRDVEVKPLLDQAQQDNPVTGQFAPIDENKYRQLDEIYGYLEKNTFKFHAALIRGLRMQTEWMQEYGYQEPHNNESV